MNLYINFKDLEILTRTLLTRAAEASNMTSDTPNRVPYLSDGTTNVVPYNPAKRAHAGMPIYIKNDRDMFVRTYFRTSPLYPLVDPRINQLSEVQRT